MRPQRAGRDPGARGRGPGEAQGAGAEGRERPGRGASCRGYLARLPYQGTSPGVAGLAQCGSAHVPGARPSATQDWGPLCTASHGAPVDVRPNPASRHAGLLWLQVPCGHPRRAPQHCCLPRRALMTSGPSPAACHSGPLWLRVPCGRPRRAFVSTCCPWPCLFILCTPRPCRLLAVGRMRVGPQLCVCVGPAHQSCVPQWG